MAIQGSGTPCESDNLAFILPSLPGSGNLAITPENGDDLALPGKGTRTVGYPYISHLRFWNFRDAVITGSTS
jgi:hypothetical protein